MPYCVSSAVAIVPWSILFCYCGSLARNITEILEGKAGPSGRQSLLLLAASGVVLVFAVVYSTIIARCGCRGTMWPDGPRTPMTASFSQLCVRTLPPRRARAALQFHRMSASGCTFCHAICTRQVLFSFDTYGVPVDA